MSWEDTLKIDMEEYARSNFPFLPNKKNKKPMDRVSTTASKLPQDEEAAERTKKKEAELLEQIMARNKKAKEALRRDEK
tara:strand:- start:1058 stop:1294 length:237 start_codon:yes stop_codon:yes gene_type:complete